MFHDADLEQARNRMKNGEGRINNNRKREGMGKENRWIETCGSPTGVCSNITQPSFPVPVIHL
jgi:hypothetical protein